MFDELIELVRDWYGGAETIPLHAPRFGSTDRQYVVDAIDSTFVSSAGAYVDRFEREIRDYTGAPAAVATVNGTAALQLALRVVGVQPGDAVITQPLTFVATANAIDHVHADPFFIDVDRDTMGMSPQALSAFLQEYGERREGGTWHRPSQRRIGAIVPVHVFGQPCRIRQLCEIAQAWDIPVVEDAAEALGSTTEARHCGTFGALGVYSFNGNKTITTGGGGAIVGSEDLVDRARHLATTAKKPHRWAYDHDMVGYNFRMPNLNAALGCAQLERLEALIADKRELARAYASFFNGVGWASFVEEPPGCRSNCWLHAIVVADDGDRDALLRHTNDAGIMTRPIWRLMTELPMYRSCPHDGVANARWLEPRVVNLPSSPRGIHG